MKENFKGETQLPKESRNLPAQPQFRIPHEIGAEGKGLVDTVEEGESGTN